MNNKCKCLHHGLNKVIVLLVWFSAVGFWWATVFKQTLLWMDSEHFFQDVIILGVLVLVSKDCGCCGASVKSGGVGVCSHGLGCKCEDCDRCK